MRRPAKKHQRLKLAAPFVVGLLVIVGAAIATPGIGVLSAPVHARGTIAEALNVQSSSSGVELRTRGAVDVVTQQITIAAGGSTGWHGHPGPVLVTIKSGAMTIVYANAACAGRTYTAGQSFLDRGDETVHNAHNLGSAPLEIWATYLVPGSPGAAFRIDSPDPGTCTGPSPGSGSPAARARGR